MRPPQTFIDTPAVTRDQIITLLHGPWRTATRLVMVLLSTDGMAPAEIADLLAYHPGTVRRWLHRFTGEGLAGLPDRPRTGRPRLGQRLLPRITRLLSTPGPWTITRLWQRLGRPTLSLATLTRRVHAVAAWRRPRLIAKSDPDHDTIVAGIRRRIARLPTGSVVLAEDEKHLDLLPAVRATWTLHGHRHQVMTPGKNRRATIFGAIDLVTGVWRYLWARRSATGFVALLQMLLDAYPAAPAIAVICDNDATHHAAKVTRFATGQPRLHLIYSARYSPQDNPVERIWAALLAHIANTPVTWTDRIHQARVFFRRRTPTQNLATAAPWTSPWLPKRYVQNLRSSA